MIVLIGVLIVIVGFAVRANALVVVAVAAIATGLASGLDFVEVITALGKAFTDTRAVAIVWIVLPVIGLLERAGLKERARELVSSIQAATSGRILLIYLTIRQITSALGLISLGGHAQMVRPLIAPMAEGAAEKRLGELPPRTRDRVKAHAAAADNIGMFFGEDVFIAVGSILLIQSFLRQNNINVEALDLALWAIPTAILAFVIQGTRLLLLDRRLAKLAAVERGESR
jgi:uncharacterized membrane protein